MSQAAERLRLRVEGRVQGVGYRWFARSVARAAGVVGWVKNLADGSVLCEAQGTAAQLSEFAAELQRGPPFARVERIATEDVAPPPRPESDFEITR